MSHAVAGLAQGASAKAVINSLHGSDAWLMPNGVDRAFASCCRRQRTGDAGEAASSRPDTS
eukprot:1867107-Heterocapsa_arctica.AAC.1